MASIWRLVIFLYSLILMVLSGITVIAAIGRPEPMEYINMALSTPQNRIIAGVVAIAVFVITLMSLLSAFKLENKQPTSSAFTIQNTLTGQISITVPAVKAIIMKAIKKVEGVKGVESSLVNGTEGLIVNLHIMISPEQSVPETTKNVQDIVKKHLEEIGGLQVAEVKIVVDDFGTSNQPATI